MTGWEWVALLAALVGVPAAIFYAVQGSLAEAYEKGYRLGYEKGLFKGFSEGSRTVRTHSTDSATRRARKGQKAGGKGKDGPPA